MSGFITTPTKIYKAILGWGGGRGAEDNKLPP